MNRKIIGVLLTLALALTPCLTLAAQIEPEEPASPTDVGVQSYASTRRVHQLAPQPSNMNAIVPDYLWGSDTSFRQSMVKHFGKPLNQVTYGNVWYTTVITGGPGNGFTCNASTLPDIFYYMPYMTNFLSEGGTWGNFDLSIYPNLREIWISWNPNINQNNINLNGLRSDLKTICLQGTGVSGYIDFRRFTQAQTLRLYNNPKLVCSTDFSMMPNLEFLGIYDTATTGNLNLTNLTKLKEAHFQHTGISSITGLNTTANLTIMNAGYTNIRSLPGIRYTLIDLTLDYSKIRDVNFVGSRKNWKVLSLRGLELKSLPSLNNNGSLERLDIGDNFLTTTIGSLNGCNRLNTISLDGNQLTKRPIFPGSVSTINEEGNLYYEGNRKLYMPDQNLKRGVAFSQNDLRNAIVIRNRATNGNTDVKLFNTHQLKMTPIGSSAQYFEQNNIGEFVLRKDMILPAYVTAKVVINDGSGVETNYFKIYVSDDVISATVPVKIVASIDPNKPVIDYSGNQSTDATDSFLSPSVTVSNDCNMPLNISVQSITPKSGSIPVKPHNAFSNDEWQNLNEQQSADNIAFGFVLDAPRQWQETSIVNGWYSPGSPYMLGKLSGQTGATFHMQSKYGLSHQQGKRLEYEIVYRIAK